MQFYEFAKICAVLFVYIALCPFVNQNRNNSAIVLSLACLVTVFSAPYLFLFIIAVIGFIFFKGGVRPVMQIDNAINIHWIRSGETVESFDPAEEATLLVSLPPTTGFFYHAVVLVLEHDKENL